jgi:type IV secretion system protein VirB4
MTRANAEAVKNTPWFTDAGSARSIVPISRFVSDLIFALKGGGYGCLFSLTGVDEESLSDLELQSRVRAVEGALRGLPEGSCLYQYTRVRAGYDIPMQEALGEYAAHAHVPAIHCRSWADRTRSHVALANGLHDSPCLHA